MESFFGMAQPERGPKIAIVKKCQKGTAALPVRGSAPMILGLFKGQSGQTFGRRAVSSGGGGARCKDPPHTPPPFLSRPRMSGWCLLYLIPKALESRRPRNWKAAAHSARKGTPLLYSPSTLAFGRISVDLLPKGRERVCAFPGHYHRTAPSAPVHRPPPPLSPELRGVLVHGLHLSPPPPPAPTEPLRFAVFGYEWGFLGGCPAIQPSIRPATTRSSRSPSASPGGRWGRPQGWPGNEESHIGLMRVWGLGFGGGPGFARPGRPVLQSQGCRARDAEPGLGGGLWGEGCALLIIGI